jgi:hypothetical protein
MPFPKTYQPEIRPLLIKALHHEAKLRQQPMTKLLNLIVSNALANTPGMQRACEEIAAVDKEIAA